MVKELGELRKRLRPRLLEELQSAAMADWVLSLVLPECARMLQQERQRMTELADNFGDERLAAAVRSGRLEQIRPTRDHWTRNLPFTQA